MLPLWCFCVPFFSRSLPFSQLVCSSPVVPCCLLVPLSSFNLLNWFDIICRLPGALFAFGCLWCVLLSLFVALAASPSLSPSSCCLFCCPVGALVSVSRVARLPPPAVGFPWFWLFCKASNCNNEEVWWMIWWDLVHGLLDSFFPVWCPPICPTSYCSPLVPLIIDRIGSLYITNILSRYTIHYCIFFVFSFLLFLLH